MFILLEQADMNLQECAEQRWLKLSAIVCEAKLQVVFVHLYLCLRESKCCLECVQMSVCAVVAVVSVCHVAGVNVQVVCLE